MTLQLRVGGTYRARNGDVVKIVAKNTDEWDIWPFLGHNDKTYRHNGKYYRAELNELDLIEEVSAMSPASELDEAIAKFEREWDAAKEAMDKARWAAKGVIQAARKAGTNVQG